MASYMQKDVYRLWNCTHYKYFKDGDTWVGRVLNTVRGPQVGR